MNAITLKPMDWATLSDIEDVAPLNEADNNCIQEIYNVLKKHNRQDRFGLTLIHKHFDLAEDEIMVEYSNPVTRTLTIKPEKTSNDLLAKSVQTSWALNEEGGEMTRVCRTRCFLNIQGGHSSDGHQWV
ncbi:hypothetical protein [Asticcacaulis sp. AND118]|uniref:hypothetical protein n=1 Tax=Asticcacaulis sp. AND118 TaxID=2840468 RepID=UPI001D0012B4|nr:hypothetical protein [Asticcacaulis sp. AND118]UDF03740.1 hypothetical protein LH365_01470 [Asticcacaulis sp. AND118]